MPATFSAVRQRVGARVADDVQVPRGIRAVDGHGQLGELAEPGRLVVAARRAAALAPGVEVRQLEPQQRRLQLVEARVVAHQLEALLVARAVEAQHPHALGDLVVRARHRAAVAEAAEVLGGEEGEAGHGRRAHPAWPAAVREPAACAASSTTGTPSASISRTGATLPNRCTAMTAFVAGVRAARTVSAVTQNVSRVDVAEHGAGARERDRLRRGVEGERRDDDVVARADAERAEGEHQGVRAVRRPRRRGACRGRRRSSRSKPATSGPRM